LVDWVSGVEPSVKGKFGDFYGMQNLGNTQDAKVCKSIAFCATPSHQADPAIPIADFD
jgi:hypothetical protein